MLVMRKSIRLMMYVPDVDNIPTIHFVSNYYQNLVQERVFVNGKQEMWKYANDDSKPGVIRAETFEYLLHWLMTRKELPAYSFKSRVRILIMLQAILSWKVSLFQRHQKRKQPTISNV